MATRQIRISGKVLGQLVLADFCPRCFWITMRCNHKLPYQIFPGVFASIDSFTKKVSVCHFTRHGRTPRWLAPFGDLGQPLPVPHHSVFQTLDAKTSVLLTGVPDELYRRKDRSLVILDNKTARFTPNQDELLPVYVVQLNAYAYIAEKLKMGRVSGLGLVYYEPQTELTSETVDGVLANGGFNMGFMARTLPIELRPAMIPPLLKKVRQICDQPSAPPGRKGCEECEKVERLVEAVNR